MTKRGMFVNELAGLSILKNKASVCKKRQGTYGSWKTKVMEFKNSISDKNKKTKTALLFVY